MQYPVQIEGFEDQMIEVKAPGLVAGPKLLVNGQPAAKGPKRNQFVLRRLDGSEAVAQWKPRLLGLDVPQLLVDGKTVEVAPSLQWYEWLWAALPLLLIFGGGAVGGFFGAMAFYTNIKLFRSSLGSVAKYAAAGAVLIAAGILYAVVATLLAVSIGG